MERPASVVKEAVENSIDAGASDVKVSLFEGGKLRIVVEDDGEGIAFDDLRPWRRPVTPQARSARWRSWNGYSRWGSEALASIASVSRFEIRSRRAEDETGGLLRIKGRRGDRSSHGNAVPEGDPHRGGRSFLYPTRPEEVPRSPPRRSGGGHRRWCGLP